MTATPAPSTYLATANSGIDRSYLLIIHAVTMARVPDLQPSEPRTPVVPPPRHDISEERLSEQIQPHEWEDPPKLLLILRVVLDRILKVSTQAAVIIATTPIPGMGNMQTTVAGGIKTLVMVLTLFLTGTGLDVSAATGVIALPPGSGWMLTAAAVLYLLLTAAQGLLSESRPDRSVKTSVVVIAKALMGGIGTVLLSKGIDVTSGQIMLTPTAEGWIIATVCGYFVLSALQATLTVDWNGDTGIVAFTGIIKAVLGAIGALLVGAGVEFTPDGPVLDGGEGIWGMALFGGYSILSFLQALATKDKTPATPVAPAL